MRATNASMNYCKEWKSNVIVRMHRRRCRKQQQSGPGCGDFLRPGLVTFPPPYKDTVHIRTEMCNRNQLQQQCHCMGEAFTMLFLPATSYPILDMQVNSLFRLF
jgi:hypothetical protein